MKHETIRTLLERDPMLAPRGKTDKLFPFPAGSFDYRGHLDHAVRFIEDFQLLNTELWAKFVKVFTETPKPDTADLGWRGEYWGKMMRGACITYQYTQNPALYKVLTDTVEEMLSAPEADGRISAYDRENEFKGWDIWCRKYVMLGLEYFLEICTDEALCARILPVIKGEADYMIDRIGEGKLDIGKTSNYWQSVNSSSVLEPIVRLYNLTGEAKYLNFAGYIVDRGAADTQNLFDMALSGRKKPHQWAVIKAYEIMSCFEGLLEYYRVTGIEKHRQAALNFGRAVYETEVSIIGSCGCWHELFNHTAKAQLSTEYTGLMQETCVTVTWMKFCLQLLCLTGDCRYADELERSAYNGMVGAVNLEKSQNNHGFPFDSYSPLQMGTRARYTGGHKVLSDGSSYGCCACIGSAGTGLIPYASMLLREDGVAVNLYLPGTAATHTPNGMPLEIAVKTHYPAEGMITIHVDTTSPLPFTLALRIPSWSVRTTLAVNAEIRDVTPGTYAELNRVWKCGDTVELFLDMRTRVVHPDPALLPDEAAAHQIALLRGPLVLARDARLPDDLHRPVSVAEDMSGHAVEVLPLKEVPFLHTAAFAVKQKDGTYLPVVDYASAGRTWDDRSLMCAWMHTEERFPFDRTKPFCLQISNYQGSGAMPADCPSTKTRIAWDEAAKAFVSPADTPLQVTMEEGKEQTCRFAVGEQYLAVNGEGMLTLSKKGTPFTLHWQGYNCYAITDPEGRWLTYTRGKVQKPLSVKEGDMTAYCLFDLVNV